MRKRMLSLFLSIVMLITMLPVPVSADEAATPETDMQYDAEIVETTVTISETSAPAETEASETEVADVPVEPEEDVSEEDPAEDAQEPSEISFEPAEEAPALAAAASCGSNLTWELSSKGILTISGSGAMTDYADPSMVPWFSSRYSVEAVELPAGLTTIGDNAFAYMTNLGGINIPEGVTAIGDGAFLNCIDMSFVTIPDSVTSIGSSAFRYCSVLKSVALPQGLTAIGEYAFDGCSAITAISVPASAAVGAYAFSNCASLKTVQIADGVPSIGKGAFAGCMELAEVTLPGTITAIAEQLFLNCYKLTGIVVPEGVASIGASAFNSCTSLASALLPSTLKSIGDHAFYNCAALTGIDIPTGVTSIGTAAFQRCGALISVTIPAGVAEIGAQAFEDCSALTELTIPSGVTAIGSSAFRGCNALESVTIPDTVTTMGSGAFENCSGLTTVVLSENLTSIPANAFSGCSALNAVDIPESVTSVGNGAFTGCSGLNTLTVPGTVEIIGDGAFAGCSGLTEITLSEGVGSIGDSAFAGCSGLKEITVPGSAGTIGEGAFSGCTGLTKAVIQEGVTLIGDSAFHNCSALTEVTIPGGVTTISGGAFAGCSSLAAISIPASVTSLGEDVFTGCASDFTITYAGTMAEWFDLCNGNCYPAICSDGTITNYGTFGEGMRWMLTEDGTLIITGDGTVTPFLDDSIKSQITSIVIQDGITAIADHAFEGLPNVTSVEIPNSVTSIGESAFEGCSSLIDLNVPGTVKEIGENAFANCGSDLVIEFGGTAAQWDNLYSGTGFEVSCVDGGSGSCGEDLKWTIDAEGTLTITGTGNVEDFLTDIQKSFIQKVVLSEGVTGIGEDTFSGCTNLTDVVLPETLTDIGPNAFGGCTRLDTITIPESVTEIADNAFQGCDDLTITYPGTIDQFVTIYGGESIPVVCPDDTYVEYGSAGENASWALDDEGNLTVTGTGNVEDFLPADLRDDVKTVEVGSGITGIGEDTFSGCTNLTDVVLPETLTDIGPNAFGGCTGLDTITIPESVTEIADNAFQGCDDLTITYPGTIDQFVTIYGGESIPVVCPDDTYVEYGSAGENASWALDDEGNLTVTGTGNVEDFLPADLRDDVKSVEVGTDITGIGEDTFSGCINLTDVALPETLTDIGPNAFGGCTGLDTITIPESVTEIADNAFQGCDDLTITYPGTIDQFVTIYGGESIPVVCPDDTYVEYGSAGENASWALDDEGNLTVTGTGNVENFLPADLRDDVKTVEIASGITGIGDHVFKDCTNLTDVTISETVETMGDGVFEGCTSLDIIEFTGNAPEITGTPIPDTGSEVIVSYPADNDTWTPEILDKLGDNITPVATAQTAEVVSITAEKTHLLTGEQTSLSVELIYATDDTEVVWALAEGCEAYAELTANGTSAVITAKDVDQNETVTVTAITVGGNTTATLDLVIQPLAKGIALMTGEQDVTGASLWLDVNAEEASMTFYAQTAPEDAGDLVRWEYDASLAVFTENQDGSLTVSALPGTVDGSVSITAKTTDGTELSAQVTVNFIALSGDDKDEIPGEDPADFILFAGKNRTFKVYDATTGKPLTSKQITWSMPKKYDAFATIDKNGKLTARKVLEKVRVEVYGTITGSQTPTVSYTVDIFPLATYMEIQQDQVTVNGKTLTMGYTDAPITLTAGVHPLDGMQDVAWTISDKKEAFASYTIEGSALTITPKANTKAGTVTIKATVNDPSKKSATVKIQFGIVAESLTIDIPMIQSVRSGGTLSLTAKVTPEKVSKPGIVWSLADPADSAYVSVSNGKVKAKNVTENHYVTINAETKDGCASDSITVLVMPKAEETLILKSGEAYLTGRTQAMDSSETTTLELSAWLLGTPEGSQIYEAPQNVSWKSSKPDIASVSAESGDTVTVTLHKSGTAAITAVDADGRKATVTIKGSVLVDGLSISVKETANLTANGIEVASGKSVTLLTVTNSDAANKKATWAITEGGEYASITNAGKLTANKDLTSAKTVKVLATAADGSGKTAETTVTIRPIAQGVQVYALENGVQTFSVRTNPNMWARSSTTMEWDLSTSGQIITLNSRVYPFVSENSDRNAMQNVTWKSSSAKIANFLRDENGQLILDDSGNVQLICSGTGTVTITATAADGSGKNVNFKLKLVQNVVDFEMEPQVLASGKSLNLAKVLTVNNGEGTTTKKFSWAITGGDTDFATIASNGTLKVKAMTEHKQVEVTVTAVDALGYSESFTIDLYPVTTKLFLFSGSEDVTGKTLTLAAGESLQLTASSQPENAAGQYTWKSSDAKLATVDEDGCVTVGETVGKTVTITCTANDGSGKKATVKIKIG